MVAIIKKFFQSHTDRTSKLHTVHKRATLLSTKFAGNLTQWECYDTETNNVGKYQTYTVQCLTHARRNMPSMTTTSFDIMATILTEILLNMLNKKRQNLFLNNRHYTSHASLNNCKSYAIAVPFN